MARLASARSGHLATVTPDGRPHVVVVTFALAGENLVTAIDHKQKSTTRLQRLANVEENRRATLLVDHYDEDWSRLWWVRIDGPATVHHGGETHSSAIQALVAKYSQYRERPPEGPAIAVFVERVTFWESTP